MPRQRDQNKEQSVQAATRTEVVLEKASAPVRHHPIASLAGTGGSVAVFIVWAITLAGIRLTGTQGAATAVAFTTALLVLGRNGLRGILNFILNGTGDDQ